MPILMKALPILQISLSFALALWGLVFLTRIILTWYPQVNLKNGFWVVIFLITEPMLSMTRKIVKPIGGVDITPIIWFGFISLIRELLVGPQGIISQLVINARALG